MHNVLPQERHLDEVRSDAILLLYTLKKKIKVNLPHAFVRNLMGGKSNIGCGMVLIKIFKKVRIDVKSKA